jgi:alpha-1,6-mannosyltransferase
LIFAGRFSEEKNLDVLHETLGLLGRPYHLLLVGGGRTLRPSHNVSVLPYRRDSIELAQWLASADALVHAGSSETFGLVVVEAMACGRPVIGVRSGAIPELIDERVGELAEPDNAVSMAQAIRRLYERDLVALHLVARAADAARELCERLQLAARERGRASCDRVHLARSLTAMGRSRTG